MSDMGKWLMVLGGGLFVVGLLMYFGGRLPWFGQLPGHIRIDGENYSVFVPIGTMIVVSLLLTLVLNVIARWWR